MAGPGSAKTFLSTGVEREALHPEQLRVFLLAKTPQVGHRQRADPPAAFAASAGLDVILGEHTAKVRCFRRYSVAAAGQFGDKRVGSLCIVYSFGKIKTNWTYAG